MRNRRSPWIALLALCGILVVSRLPAADLRGRVVDRASKQPVAGVVVQVFCMGRFAASGYTNADGRFLVPIPDSAEARDVALMVTRQPAAVKTVTLRDGRNASISRSTSMLAFQTQLSLKTDNLVYADPGSGKTHP